MAFPDKQDFVPPSHDPRVELVRDFLDVMRERGINSIATPTELDEIAYGHRSIESVLV